jgi:uncharacterized Zn-finger protein
VKRRHKNRFVDVQNVESNLNGQTARSQIEDGPFACPECSKQFRFSSDLKAHRGRHTEKRPYSCSDCGKTFKQSTNLNVHMKIHTKENPYMCSVCGKQVRNLRNHMVIHSGEKPYSCSACEKTFFRLFQLRHHRKKYHDSETSRENEYELVCPQVVGPKDI